MPGAARQRRATLTDQLTTEEDPLPRTTRVAVAIFAAGAVLAGCGTPSAPAALHATITVSGGRPEGGVKRLDVRKGGDVHLSIRSDTADEVHIHGYDLHKDVTKGGSVTFEFPARIDGEFEIELENAQEQLATLRVEP